jgi:hypothetical protein
VKKSPSQPQEDPSIRVQRERSIRDLAEIDEEENRRLKMAFKSRRGVRAFRPSARGGGGSTSGGSGGSGGAGAGGGGGGQGSVGGGRRTP